MCTKCENVSPPASGQYLGELSRNGVGIEEDSVRLQYLLTRTLPI